MAKVNAPLLAFNSGEISKRALARVDVEKLRLAAECQVNWCPDVLGPMMLRPGLEQIGEIKSSNPEKIIPFIFGNTDTALIECTNNVMRFWIDDALLTRPSVSTTVTSGDFSASTGWTLENTNATATISGGFLILSADARGATARARQQVTVAVGDRNVEHAFRISVTRGPVTVRAGSTNGAEDFITTTELDTGLHSLSFTPTGDIFLQIETRTDQGKNVDSIQIEAGGTVELTTTWAAADLPYLRWTQSADVVYVACDGQQQRKIERRGDGRSWSYVLYRSADGPFSSGRTAPVRLRPNGSLGNITLLSDANFFRSEHIGVLFRLHFTSQDKVSYIAGTAEVSEAIKVTGIGADRTLSYSVGGIWVGTVTLQRSLEGPDSGFINTDEAVTANASDVFLDGTSFDNVEVWYRFKFTVYTSGYAQVRLTFGGGDGTCVVRVTGITDATTANIEVLTPVTNPISTDDWEEGEWSDNGVWPTSVALHDGRLFWAGRDVLWGSVSDDYESFDDEVEGESGTINRTVGAGPVDTINWLLPLTRLIVGREGSETSARASSQDEPLTPVNITLKDCSTQGSNAVAAVKIDTRGVFVEKSARRLYELGYQVEIQDYRARDITHLNPDVGLHGFDHLAIQRQPDTVIHAVRGDGQVACITQSNEDAVEAIWRVMTLGVVEDVAVLPGALEDTVYYVVQRTINGSTKRFLEKFALRTQCQGGSLSRNLDCFKVVSQASSTTITGLSHLEGETVYVWANGKDLGSYTVASGSITASEAVTTAIVGLGGVSFSYDSDTASATLTAAAKYNGYPAEVFASGASGQMEHIGSITVAAGLITLPNGRTAKKITAYLGFYAPFRSAKLAYAAQMGTALAQPKKVEAIGLLMLDTHYQGLKTGSSIDNMQPLPLTEGGQDTAADTIWREYDRPMIGLSGSWDTNSRIHLLAQAPKPVTVQGLVVAVNTNG